MASSYYLPLGKTLLTANIAGDNSNKRVLSLVLSNQQPNQSKLVLIQDVSLKRTESPAGSSRSKVNQSNL